MTPVNNVPGNYSLVNNLRGDSSPVNNVRVDIFIDKILGVDTVIRRQVKPTSAFVAYVVCIYASTYTGSM